MRGCLWWCIRVLASLIILGFLLPENIAVRVEPQFNTFLVRTRDRGFATHHRKGVFPRALKPLFRLITKGKQLRNPDSVREDISLELA